MGRHHVVCCGDEAASHQCGLLNHLDSFCGGMFKFNAKFDADSLLYSLSHFEWDSLTIHMLTQEYLLPPLTITVKLSLFTLHIPVHSPWLPGYIDVAQTILLILTMAGIFLDRPCKCSRSFFICLILKVLNKEIECTKFIK